MLSSSATNMGLPHKLTRNMVHIVYKHLNAVKHSRRPWNPQLLPDSRAYTPAAATPKKKESFDPTSAWRAVAQVVKLAEGQSGIHLGRIPVRKRRI